MIILSPKQLYDSVFRTIKENKWDFRYCTSTGQCIVNNQIIALADEEQVVVSIKGDIIIQYVLNSEYYYDVADSDKYFNEKATITYIIACTENKHPTKRWTFTDAVNRVLQLAEPLYKGEEPRFKLNEAQATKYANTYIPETTMTSCTLREQLKHLGNFIHAEPRLGGYDENGVYQENWIFFDEYGGTEISTLKGKKYVYNNIKQSINDYCTEIDTTAENVINTLDYGQGVVYSPDTTNYKSLRTENINVRLQESNCIIATEYPIYDVVDINCRLIYYTYDENGNSVYNHYDFGSIKPYVYEAHEYNSVLSSYGGTYPYAKAYAIYYTQGEKNIKGLFFKPTEKQSAYIESDYLTNYAIVNILKSLNKKDAPDDIKGIVSSNFGYLSFNVSYIPIYNTRFKHSKGYLSTKKQLPFAKIYNQSENVIETRYYGENVKGIAQRLGNQEAIRTYIYGKLSDMPKTGTLLDGYYISSVTTEFTDNYIKSTVGLTKNFNRLSQNVGINSHKRVYEVSEREAYDRDIVIKEYICIGDYNVDMPYETSKLQTNIASMLKMFNSTVSDNLLQSVAVFTTKSAKNRKLSRVQVPVISSAFGNSIIFSFAMKDNYSAGEKVDYLLNSYSSDANSENTEGAFWQTDVPYSDYYGRAYYCDIAIGNQVSNSGNEDVLRNCTCKIGEDYTIKNKGITIEDFLLRKDSREKLKFNIEIEYVTNRRDLIIGDALASSNPLVTNRKADMIEVFFFDKKISPYEKKFDENNIVKKSAAGEYLYKSIDVQDDHISFKIPSQSFKSWAIAYITQSSTTEKVYNEETDSVEIAKNYPVQEILIACNNGSEYYTSYNQTEEKIYFKAYRDKIKYEEEN
ncbi:MAG: hypothetical protein J6A95_00830 [Clostridia bacterium]|nr:hypothetical protein [Clostridia bacterium]